MKTKKDWALYHAKQGWYVFRLIPNGKTPKRKGWQVEATRDLDEIEKMWSGRDAECNIGAFTSKFEDDAAIIVDIDMKKPEIANGDATLSALIDAGYIFPDTLTQMTPTGGRHLCYRAPWAVKQGAAVLGRGLDIRSRGGFIVMAGSTVDAGTYVTDFDKLADVPKWLFAQLAAAPVHEVKKRASDIAIDAAHAKERALKFLERVDLPEQGRRNDMAFKIAAEIKDLGNDEDATLVLVLDDWNALLDDPLDEEEIIAVVMSAFKHGQNEIGSKAIENLMPAREPVPMKVPEKEIEDEDQPPRGHPFDDLNKEFAIVVSGGSHHILHETTDQDGHRIVHHIQEPTFHRMRSHLTISLDNAKPVAMTKAWLNDERARRYLGMVFEPQRAIDPRYYNLWKGFPVEPQLYETATYEEQRSFDLWKEHVKENVCNGDDEQFRWLMAWCADLIQRPWRKPLASVVLKGDKGVGKNIFAEALGELLAPHSMLIDDPRFLNSHFNSHMESLKLLIVDEASWGGDKGHEGHLKGLITGKKHTIERKGKEPYSLKNILALIFMSNSNWVVPASFDERRFYVTDVGSGRKQDRKFFGKIVDRSGSMIGIGILMNYLLTYDMEGFDTDVAPNSEGLLGQKIASLDPLEQWWFDCLSEATLVGSMAKGIDFSDIHCDTFNRAFFDYVKGRHVRSRLPTADLVKKILKKIAPSMQRKKVKNEYHYISDGLEVLREDWERYIGSTLTWEPIDKGELECLK